MQPYDFIVPLGITTYGLVLVTMFFGMRTKILPAATRRKVHIVLSVLTLLSATAHAALVLYIKFMT
jgi:hypothetical protein